MRALKFATRSADVIRRCSPPAFTIAGKVRPRPSANMKYPCRHWSFRLPLYEGVQLTKTAGPVTYPPHLARRQPPQAARCRCL